ncbi:MAG: hypothetical protein WC489_00980 [Patescibacteria group bacterium]
MEQFNKAISFVLGLLVVVIFLAVATGKINLKNRILPFTKGTSSNKTTVTPTRRPTPTAKAMSLTQKGATPTASNSNRYQTTTPKTIPNTGPALAIPLFVSVLTGGLYLRRSAGKAGQTKNS